MIRSATLVRITIIGTLIFLVSSFHRVAPVAQAQPRSGTVTQCGSSTSSKFLENLQILSNYIYDPNKGKNSLPSGSRWIKYPDIVLLSLARTT